MTSNHRDWKVPAQRQAELRELLRSRRAATVAEIATALNVSESTARRDIDKLSGDGIISRSHGGAIIAESTTFEPLFEDRRLHNPQEKARIGKHALTLLKPGQSVIFDSSSTVLSAVEALSQNPIPITAISNDVKAASELALIPQVSVVMPGGEVREGSFTLLGSYTKSFFDNLHADVALLGIHAITGTVLSEAGLSVADIKRAIIGAAQRVILLVDHSKFGPPAFFEVANLEAIHDLITDNATPKNIIETIETSAQIQTHVV